MAGDIVSRLCAEAERVETPCGDGGMVWHCWPATGAAAASARAPVVLLHGGSGSWTHWVRNIDALRVVGREVWAADLPGFGDSARPASGGDADALIAPLALGLTVLLSQGGATPGPEQRCDLVGFSFGGMTAGMLLAAYPHLAQRLVLVGAPAMGVVPERQFELKAWRHLTNPAEQDVVQRDNLAALMLHDRAQIDGLALDLHKANLARDRMPRRRLSHTDILARSLPQVACPVHAIYGAHDALYKQWISQLEAAYAAVTPNFRGMTLIADAGHWVQFERPGAFDAALRAALEEGNASA